MKLAHLMGAAILLAAGNAVAQDDAVLTPWPSVAKVDFDDPALTAMLKAPEHTGIGLVSADVAKVSPFAVALSFDLAPDLKVKFKKKNSYVTEDGSVVWYGTIDDKSRSPGSGLSADEIDDDPLNSAMIVQNGEDLAANFHVGRRSFKLRPLRGAPHVVVEVDEALTPPDHPAEFKSIPTVAMGPADGGKATSTIRVMVVITNAAASASGNASALINLAVAETNQGYTNSGVEINMQLAGWYQTSYVSTSSFSTDLSRFRGTTDGYMDSYHATRNSIAADVAVLLINNSSSCGLASGIGSSASTAFAVAHWDCATGYYSFGHEVGHLQSARHDPATDPTNTPYVYGHGYRYPAGGWRTIMAYNCSGGCTRINYWSNPNKTYGGVPMGTTNRSHNQRVLQNTKATIAAFR